ncbi:MAG: class I SAM-dependent methyltransferase [Leptolyngbyaceae cyanobacterium]
MELFAGSVSSSDAKDRYLSSLESDINCDKFSLGENTTRILYEDPKLLLFTLARYKFVAKMFDGFDNVLEVGCQEGFGASIVAQNVNHLHGVDFYLPYIESCNSRIRQSNMTFEAKDILDSPMSSLYSGVFALDVLEHIEKDQEHTFMFNILRSLKTQGVVILGMPSLESQKYASKASKIGHVNCKTGQEFKSFACNYFENVFLFSMNDEVLHTGFFPMSHYLLMLGCNPKNIN